jgi:hypothetical protein
MHQQPINGRMELLYKFDARLAVARHDALNQRVV